MKTKEILKHIEVNGVTIELTKDQVKKILEQTKIKVTKELVKQEIIEMLEKYKSNVRFIDENCEVSNYPTSRFEIFNENGEWLFDIDYDSKNPRFLFSYYRVLVVFNSNYSIKYDDFQEVMKSILEEHLNLNGEILYCFLHNTYYKLEEHLNLNWEILCSFFEIQRIKLEEHLNLNGEILCAL